MNPQERAAHHRAFIARYEQRAANAPKPSRERTTYLFWAKQQRKELQRLKSKYKHIPNL